MTTWEQAHDAPTLPGGLPLVGHLRDIARDHLGLFRKASAAGHDVVGCRIGPQPIAIVCDPELVETVLVRDVKHYSKRTRGYDVVRKLVGNGLLTSEGSFWLRQRRIAQPAFHRELLVQFAQSMRVATEEMVTSWRERMESGASFDVSHELMRLTMRIVSETLLSTDVTRDADVLGKAITELLHQVLPRTRMPLRFPDFVPTPMNRRFRHAQRVLDDAIMGIIRARRAGAGKRDLLSMLMDAVDEETGERMNDAQLKDEVMTLFIAGHETTATALSWTLYLLGTHPDIEKQLRAEVDAVIGGGAVGVEHFSQLRVLDAVIKEAMRLYPPIWTLARFAEEDRVLGTTRIPRGTYVFVAPWILHHHPKLWTDPERFLPERFLQEDPSRPRYAYFPFSGGPRKCIGDFFAQMEAKILLATILQRTTLSLVPGKVVAPEPVVTLRPRGGVWVTARTRETS